MASQKILIVEDESILALDLEDILTQAGYQVIGTAIDATETMGLLSQELPNLVLLDVLIGGAIDGIDLAEEIWEQYRLPMIFITASLDETTLQRIETSPAHGFIPKPFMVEHLLLTIKTLLEEK